MRDRLRPLLVLSAITTASWVAPGTSHANETNGGAGDGEDYESSYVYTGDPATPEASHVAASAAVDDREITTDVGLEAVTSWGSASGTGRARPRCTYRWAALLDTSGAGHGGLEDATVRYRDRDTKEVVDAPGPGVEELMRVDCPGQPGRLRWIPPADEVDHGRLVRLAHDRARALVPLPTQEMNPAPEHGAPAQLGLWLAVADQGQINVVAQLGPHWAAVTATYQETTWDMGNGDSVACDGLGTPYPWGSDLVEQGPCGYTYRLPSDIGTRAITVSGTWELHLTTSTGRNEYLDPVTASTTIDYLVYEIVTVGGWDP